MINNNPKLNFVGILTNFYHSDVFERLMALGSDAVVLYQVLMMDIYNVNYEMMYDDGVELEVAGRMHLSTAEVKAYLHEMLKLEIFDSYMMKQYSILTSQEIQVNYMVSAIKLNRKSVEFDINHILVPMSKRREFRLILHKKNPNVVKMYDKPEYEELCAAHGNATTMQRAIEYKGQALVKRRERIEARGRKAAAKKAKKQQLHDKETDEAVAVE